MFTACLPSNCTLTSSPAYSSPGHTVVTQRISLPAHGTQKSSSMYSVPFCPSGFMFHTLLSIPHKVPVSLFLRQNHSEDANPSSSPAGLILSSEAQRTTVFPKRLFPGEMNPFFPGTWGFSQHPSSVAFLDCSLRHSTFQQ